jgi:hypothetical protein
VICCDITRNSDRAPPKDYSINGDAQNRVFGVFNAIAVIATIFCNGIIPEIQATVAAPVTGQDVQGAVPVLRRGGDDLLQRGHLWVLGVRQPGAGHAAEQLHGERQGRGPAVAPPRHSDLHAAADLSGGRGVPAADEQVLEGILSDPKQGQHASRNVVPRLVSRTIAVAFAVTVAAMVPFFGDMNAFGFLPFDFAVPAVFYNLTFKPSRKGFVFWLNTTIAVVFSALAVIASVAAVRQIALDANTFKLFANV